MNDHIEISYRQGDIEEFHKELINHSLWPVLPGNILENQDMTLITYCTKVTWHWRKWRIWICRALSMIAVS